MARAISGSLLVTLLAAGFGLTGCGGGGGTVGTSSTGSGSPTTYYTVGGTVTGLTSGAQVTLLDNGGNALAVGAGGSFQFSAPIASGSQYTVTVGTQPTGQTCTVNGGSGLIAANVTNVSVVCSASTYTVGGNVVALPGGSSVVLENNGTDPITLTAAGPFTFSSALASGASYAVTASAPGDVCTVTDGSGTASSNVSNVSVSCAAGAETVLYSFAGGTTDGAAPYSGLVMDANGNLYGTTSFGGMGSTSSNSGNGTVFKLTLGSGGAYTETVLHFFAGGATDGTQPGSLIMDANGNLYGTTVSGGVSNFGTVFKLTPGAGGTYTETVLYSFAGGATDGAQPDDLIMDASGNLYGTTSGGGSSNTGTVFKLTPGAGGTYTETILYTFLGYTAGDGSSPVGLVMDAHGNLYGTTSSGGPSNTGTVFKLTPGAGGTYTETVLYSFSGTIAGPGGDGAVPQAGVIMDASGNLYGTTELGGHYSSGTVFKLTPGTSGAYTETILYSFEGTALYGTTGTIDAENPKCVLVMDASGNLYGTTTNGGTGSFPDGTVFKLTPGSGGTYAETILHSFGSGTSDGAGPWAGLIMDAHGNLYGTTIAGYGAGADGTVFKIN